MSWITLAPRTLSTAVSSTFGALCITSALPFIGIPFPSQSWADYYADKNKWLAELSSGRLTPAQAGYAGALLRVGVGACCIYPPTREAALLLNGAVVCRGTVLAYRDERPMRPQWTMLSAIALCLVLGRL
ncbi:Major facilitator superfamily transporter [Mycena kentingensis (nom. inval.)]|nr:Major facilitator superfamily transporter [Mycena kentingensis (nom. inval.)]